MLQSDKSALLIPSSPAPVRFGAVEQSICFHARSGEVALKITADRIVVGEGVEVTEAAQAVLDALSKLVLLPSADAGPYTVWKDNRTNWNGVRPVGYIVARVTDPTALYRVIGVSADGKTAELVDLSEPYFLPVEMPLADFMPVSRRKMPSWIERLTSCLKTAVTAKKKVAVL